MRKKFIITGLIIANLLTGFFLGVSIWHKNLWQTEAMNYSKFAAGLWAVSDFHKGKLKKLRLRIEDQPNININKNVEFEEGAVVKDWVGYAYSCKVLKGYDSPDIQVARNVVIAYNSRMQKCNKNPELYKKRLADELDNWNEIITKTNFR